MQKQVVVRPNTYQDSVSLMALSQRLSVMAGVVNAVVVMGTDMNKELLRNVGLLTEAASTAGPTDLIIAVEAKDAAAVVASIGDRAVATSEIAVAPRSIAAAVRAVPDVTLALISVPGAHAAREARNALEHGLDVMLYSDNVAVADEVRLKRLALEKGRLLMGPDCGTAILDGVGLGFANAVRRGSIGIVAASGTGAQELSCLIDRLGEGVSQLIGTGGRDLSSQVGGLMTLEGLRRLQADPATERIVLVSKPPAPEVAERIRTAASTGEKPVVLCFMGEVTLDEVAELVTGNQLDAEAAELQVRPGRVVGLFSGGTLCQQARAILGEGHELIDLGDDRFTVGRPHPMIDPTLRRRMLLEVAAKPDTAVILLDVVLGYGAHPDPAGALADAIRAATGNGVAVVASVTGTEADPQRLGAQEATLRAAGAVVAPTACQAALAVKEAMRR